MKKCSWCGQENKPSAIRCDPCGTPFPDDHTDLRPKIGRAIAARLINPASVKLILCGVVLLAALWCFYHFYLVHHPYLSKIEAARIAEAAVIEAGIIVTNYNAPQVEFEFGPHDRTWTIIYALSLRSPWDRSSPPTTRDGTPAPSSVFVYLNDRTKATRVDKIKPSKYKGDPVKLPPGVTVWTYTNQSPATKTK